MAHAPPWDLSPDLPWHPLGNPVAHWAAQPSFVVGELLFYVCAAVALWHAWRSGGKYLLVWVAALLAGTANDVIFMALPLVDNFWQAQAVVMLTPRLPLYIPCVYVCFMYFPTVTLWRAGLSPLARAAATGLAAIVFYAPYDIVGAKFLWWSWHDTDPRIAARILGAPIGSTMWVISFVGAFSYLVGRVADREPPLGSGSFAKGLAWATLGSTPLMVLQMTPLQFLDGGVPGPRALVALVVVYAVVVALGLRRRTRPASPLAPERLLRGVVLGYFAVLVAVMAVFDPARERSTGVHQTPGACHVSATDFAGLTRFEYLCTSDYDEPYSFDCTEPPPDGARWFTLCGTPHSSLAAWLGAVAGLGALGMVLFGSLLGARRGSRAPPARAGDAADDGGEPQGATGADGERGESSPVATPGRP